MTYDPNNIFAKIMRGDMPCVKLYEDEAVFSFMDIMPQSEGHCLVLPKTPAENLFDLPEAAARDLIVGTQKIARAAKAATQAPGIMIAQFNGAEAGQTVFHIHMHIIPRWPDQPLKSHAREMVKPEALEPLAAKIRAAL